MSNILTPTEAQKEKLFSLPMETPVAVLNLLRFNDVANYQQGDPEYNTEAAQISGREAWARYGAQAGKYILDLGGKVVFSTPVDQVLIGHEEHWDQAAIMFFPSRKDFIGMLSNPEFQKVSRHRKAALSKHTMLHLNGEPFDL